MIYTLTLCPSIDYLFRTEKVRLGDINHPHYAEFAPGGKGINVSNCLTKLGVDNQALGFNGGWTGEIIEKWLKESNVNFDFVHIDGNSRVNVKVKEPKEETAFNLDGPIVSEDDLNRLYDCMDKKLQLGDILIMGGSIGMIHRTIYNEIITRYNKKGILCVLDSHSQALKEGVKAKPFLIKPNLNELSELVGRNVSIKEVPEIGKELILDYGINYVLVSLGEEGAILITPIEVYKDKFVKNSLKVSSTVGAGDCMLAGFMTYLSKGKSVADCLHFANLCGASNCYLGHIPSLKEIEEIEK